MIEIICPRCGEDFSAWSRASFDPATSSSCPNCGHDFVNDPSLRDEAMWLPAFEDLDLEDR
jgi:hypothetical protein